MVYFPRFFDLFHRTMELWFREGLGMQYAQLVSERGIGFPAVHTEADFAAPCVFGDWVEIHQTLAHLGTKSVTFDYRVRGRADAADMPARVRGRTVCAIVDLAAARDGGRVRAIAAPDDLRAALEAFFESEGGP